MGITRDFQIRLNYYAWAAVINWPLSPEKETDYFAGANGELKDFSWQSTFEETTRGFDYFIVTLMDQLEDHPLLKTILYDHYEIYAESQSGERYIIFDLRQRKE